MNEEEQKYDVFDTILTTHDVLIASSELDKFVKRLYQQAPSVENVIQDTFHLILPAAFSHYLHTNGIDMHNLQSIEKACNDLKTQIVALSKITLVLPLQAHSISVFEIASFIKKATNKKFILAIAYDPAIVGGLQIIGNGIYKDYSVKRKIDDYYAQHIQDLKGIFI